MDFFIYENTYCTVSHRMIWSNILQIQTSNPNKENLQQFNHSIFLHLKGSQHLVQAFITKHLTSECMNYESTSWRDVPSWPKPFRIERWHWVLWSDRIVNWPIWGKNFCHRCDTGPEEVRHQLRFLQRHFVKKVVEFEGRHQLVSFKGSLYRKLWPSSYCAVFS